MSEISHTGSRLHIGRCLLYPVPSYIWYFDDFSNINDGEQNCTNFEFEVPNVYHNMWQVQIFLQPRWYPPIFVISKCWYSLFTPADHIAFSLVFFLQFCILHSYRVEGKLVDICSIFMFFSIKINSIFLYFFKVFLSQ